MNGEIGVRMSKWPAPVLARKDAAQPDADCVVYAFGNFQLLPAERLLRQDGSILFVGSRAFDLLLALVSRAGQLVGKEELLETVWPGLTVEENNLVVQVHALRRVLRDSRDNRYIQTVVGHGYRFVATVAIERVDRNAVWPKELPSPGPRSSSQPTNLVRPATPLIGREQDSARIENALKQHQLVVIIGAGGVGKSRVALQIGDNLAGHYPDGVWLVELAETAASRSIEDAIAAVFGVTADPSRSAIDAIVQYLRHQRLLLILDNCEHVVAAAARLTHAIMQQCPGISILATSRERLAVPGEIGIQLPPLPFPHHSVGMTAAQALGFASIQLFVQRTAALIDWFVLSDDDAPAAAEICRKLDGIALAIELAVPRLRVLSLKELAARLDERFGLLTGGARTALPQHQTLRALIDWSYDLLDDEEQALLRRLSIFAGGWTLRTAIGVAAVAPIEDFQVIDLMSQLIDKSLVVRDNLNNSVRYRLLESMRQYAVEKHNANREPHLGQRHADVFAALLKEADASWPTASTHAWLAEYGSEIGNVRAALDWAFGPDGDILRGQALVAHSLSLWSELGLFSELRRWFATAVASCDETTPPTIAARLWFGRGMGSVRQGYRPHFDQMMRAAELYRAIGDREGEAAALTWAGVAQLNPQHPEEAETLLDRALAMLRASGASKRLGQCLNSLAAARFLAGDVAAAQRLFGEAIDMLRALGDASTLRIPMGNLAELHFMTGDLDAAITAGRAMIDECRRANDGPRLAASLGNLAGYLLSRGDWGAARDAANDALPRSQALGLAAGVTQMIEYLALIDAEAGDLEHAARLVGYIDSWYAAEGDPRGSIEAATTTRLSDLLRGLPAHRRQLLFAEGAGWSAEQAIAEALHDESPLSAQGP